jgi:preprotein translocase subunit YajC
VNFIFAMSPQPGNQGGSMVSTLIMFGAIFAIFYFMIVRPQQKRAKEREKLLSEIQKGDKVVTSGGIHGTVEGIEEKTLLIKISDNVKIKVERSAVSNVLK